VNLSNPTKKLDPTEKERKRRRLNENAIPLKLPFKAASKDVLLTFLRNSID